jgi:hypothetical protein
MLRLWSKKHRPPEPIHDNDPVPSSCSLCHDFKPNNTHHVLNLTIEHLELRQSRQEKCRYCMLLRAVIKQLDKGDLRTTKIYLTVEAGKPVIVSTNASRRIDSYQTWYFLYRPHGAYMLYDTQDQRLILECQVAVSLAFRCLGSRRTYTMTWDPKVLLTSSNRAFMLAKRTNQTRIKHVITLLTLPCRSA